MFQSWAWVLCECPLSNPHYGVASCNGVDESFSKKVQFLDEASSTKQAINRRATRNVSTACREDWLQLSPRTRSLTGKDDEPCREAQLKGNERSRRPQLLSLFPDSARSGGRTAWSDVSR
ncbi:hypothetical protein CDAR_479781 [Caerostris darwini]|uniref:Uncharacterized protein n=1 Tax=Caerostris darwini TaxID=1538125 RepID=A0AAV4ST68_9ARAC|nr:hypothetical protein CDAR_479781 [Caerostris darwini]